jgi:hypothetical protein
MHVLPLLALVLLTACAKIGPPTIPRDRFDYVTAISDSWKRQMLLDLLKIRYTDAPVFMDISAVINSYSLEGDITLGGQYAPVGRDGETFAGLSGTARYADRPTISYQPLTGDRFARSLMGTSRCATAMRVIGSTTVTSSRSRCSIPSCSCFR